MREDFRRLKAHPSKWANEDLAEAVRVAIALTENKRLQEALEEAAKRLSPPLVEDVPTEVEAATRRSE